MRHEDHSEAELCLKVVQELDDLLLNGNVQCGSGLVADDELGVAGKRHSDKDALALAAGQLMRIALERALWIEADELEKLLGAAGAAAAGKLLHLAGDEHGGVEQGQGVLVDHGDLVAQKLTMLFLGELEQVLAIKQHLVVICSWDR